ncbi:MAG TPA: hypothetical protein VGT61_13090 [Thermomicrobiales bacterium]|jgi:hypothetical protein|nr:hypothetical protein [Thermomicrobiales bacterium]
MTTLMMKQPGETRLPMTTGLRRALMADGILTGATGGLMLAGATLLDDLLGLPAGLLAGAGAFLLLFVAAVALVASRPVIARPAIRAIIALNMFWIAESVILLFTPWPGPNGLGSAFIVLQAVVLLGLTEWQLLQLRRVGRQPVAR